MVRAVSTASVQAVANTSAAAANNALRAAVRDAGSRTKAGTDSTSATRPVARPNTVSPSTSRCAGADRARQARRAPTGRTGRPLAWSTGRRWRRRRSWCSSVGWQAPGAAATAAAQRRTSALEGRLRSRCVTHGSPDAGSIAEPAELTTASAATVTGSPASVTSHRCHADAALHPAAARSGAGPDRASRDCTCSGRGRRALDRTRPPDGCRSDRPAQDRRSPPMARPARRAPVPDRQRSRAASAPGTPSHRRRRQDHRHCRPSGTRRGCGRPDCAGRGRRSRACPARRRARRRRRPRRPGASTTVVPVCQPRPTRWWWPTRSPATSASEPVPNGS